MVNEISDFYALYLRPVSYHLDNRMTIEDTKARRSIKALKRNNFFF